MPSEILKNARTVWVDNHHWTSPDGKVNIWMIKLEVDGQRGEYRTMSKIIAEEGWQGDVELYTNDKGKEYVRQAPKEQPAQGNQQSDEYWQQRNADIRAQFAIKTAVALLKDPEADIKPELILHWANIFYDMVDHVDGAIDSSTESKTQETGSNERIDTIHEVLDEQPINLNSIPF